MKHLKSLYEFNTTTYDSYDKNIKVGDKIILTYLDNSALRDGFKTGDIYIQ